MKELIKLVEEIQAALGDESNTLKACKVMLEERIFAGLPLVVSDAINTALSKRTRESYSASLVLVIGSIEEAEADEIASEEIVELEITTEIERLEFQIAQVLEQNAAGEMRLGGLLLEAREALDDSKEFLRWCDSTFGLKKAWVYRLMQMARIFSDTIWSTTPVQTLYTLRQQANDIQWAAAEEIVREKGSITLTDVRTILGETAKPEPVAKVSPKESNKAAQLIEEALEDGEIPVSDSKSEPLPEPLAVKVMPNEPAKVFEPKTSIMSADGMNAELLKKISELTSQLAEANRKIQSLTLPTLRRGNKVPSLPQFKSRCLYARLGLSQEEAGNAQAVRDAFRELVRAGYGIGHNSYDMLNEARKGLLEALEVAA